MRSAEITRYKADLPGLNAPGVRFVIASFPLTDGARPSRDVKTIIARSVDGRIQTTQEEDTMTQTSATQRGSEQADALRPFNVNFPEAELTELHRRINATKWPERATGTDASQGVQLATSQALARYWATDYDLRTCEARLNALPN